MVERSLSRLWAMRAAYLLLALVIIFFHLIPLDTQPRRWAPPDLLIAFTFAWTLRRPEFVPALSVALVMLMADLMFQRPPGLFALLVLLGTEYLKYRAGPSDTGFAGEWAAVAIVITAVTLGNRLVLAVLLSQVPPLGASLTQMVLTIAAYPLVVAVTQLLMGVRRLSPGDARALGGAT